MTRTEAIAAIAATYQRCGQEFNVGRADWEADEQELRDALMALGVTEQELAAAGV